MNTTPEELLEYLQKNINYRITDQCYTTPDEVRLNKVASCWSAADLQYEELTAMGFRVIILFLTKLDYDRTHTATFYTNGDGWYWLEWAWSAAEGIHGPYVSFDFLKRKIVNLFIKEYGSPIKLVEHHKMVGKKGMTNHEYLVAASSIND